MTTNTHFIDGVWQASSSKAGSIDSENPATGEIIWSGTIAGEMEVNLAFKAARSAFANWAKLSFEERKKLILNYQEILKEKQQEIAQTISDETGKQCWEAKTEAATMIAKVDLSISAYEQRTGTNSKDINGTTAQLTHRPHGVLLVLGPYNFPGHLPNGHIVPALLAGNTIVYKPSEITPSVGQLMIECLEQAGLPKGVVNLLQGDGSTGALCSSHPELDGLLFTGSSNTGAMLHKQFAGQPGKVLALEMGGNNPLIFHNVSDIPAAVYQTIQSAYITSGQRCTCARRLIVVKDANGEDFVQQLVRAVNNIQVGMPTDSDAFYGPVVSNKVADSLIQTQSDMINAGAKALVTMERLSDERPLVSPALLDVTDVKDRADEEYFGPILQLIWVESLADAIKEANATRYGLAAGMLSDDDEAWQEFYVQARAGILNRNRPTTGASGGAPFGGVGASGNHRPSAFYAADYCAYPMASMNDSAPILPDTLSPGIKL